MIRVIYRGSYLTMLKELGRQNGAIVDLAEEKIPIFQKNPDDTRLFNHPLHKRLDGKWSFSITDDIRIVYEWTSKNTVRFLAIGGHTAVYH